jgi:hypothetical protein
VGFIPNNTLSKRIKKKRKEKKRKTKMETTPPYMLISPPSPVALAQAPPQRVLFHPAPCDGSLAYLSNTRTLKPTSLR